MLVGDLQTTRDGERLSPVTEDTVQINTGLGCHLSATEVAEGLVTLDLEELDYLFIENVGNMVCPVGFDLGEHTRVALLSVPEGDDKVAKYPTLFQSAQAILLTKVDLLVDMGGTLDFDIGRVKDDLSPPSEVSRVPRTPSATRLFERRRDPLRRTSRSPA